MAEHQESEGRPLGTDSTQWQWDVWESWEREGIRNGTGLGGRD